MQAGGGGIRAASFLLHPMSPASSSTSTHFASTTSSASQGFRTTSSQGYGQPQQSNSAADDEDLLALLSSDTFSLESQRDRDLVKLGSFLTNIIPSSAAQPQPIPSSSTSPFNPHSHSHTHSHFNNSVGSPMSFHSNSSGGGGPPIPPAPSSSLNNPPPPFPMLDFSNFNGFGGWGKELEGFAGKESSSFNQSRWNTAGGSRSGSGENTPMRRRSSVHRNGNEWRVPNCSRERTDMTSERNESRNGTPIGKARAGQQVEDEAANEGGWKSRLRKSTVDQQQVGRQISGRGYDDDDGGTGEGAMEEEEDDLMMDD